MKALFFFFSELRVSTAKTLYRWTASMDPYSRRYTTSFHKQLYNVGTKSIYIHIHIYTYTYILSRKCTFLLYLQSAKKTINPSPILCI